MRDAARVTRPRDGTADHHFIPRSTTAATLRSRGFNTEVYHQADKLAKQIRYASRKAIPFVWLPPFGDDGVHEIKDMTAGTQVTADPTTWQQS